MQRDSKQRPTSIAPTASPTTTTIENRAAAKPVARKRRPSRIDLGTSPARRETANPKLPNPANPCRPIQPAARTARETNRRGLSALDAAARVITALSGEEARLGITAQDLIGRMAKQKLWTSPGGKTPQATLYAAMAREITVKGASARFRKVSRGHFAAAAAKRAKP